jgi:hypothetical protein
MGTVLVILCVLLILFLISFIKEFSSNYSENRQNIYSSSQPQNTSSTTSLVDSASSVETTSSQEVSSQEVSSTPPPPPKVDKGLVPESEKVLSGYFKDAVFVGDSVTEGIKLYGIMSDATVFSYTGLGLDNIYTKDVIKQPDGTSIPVMDAVRLCNANKFYVLIGVNSIAYSKDSFIQKYAAVVQSIKEFHPNAIIYVQSITPVATNNSYNLNNKTINEYNEALLEMAIEKGVYYLDIHSALADETGALPDNATTDGLHFGPTYYQKWFDYLKTHTVS